MSSLSKFVSEFRWQELRLRRSLDRGLAAEEAADALRRCADALDRIESHVPQTPDEARDQVFFFLKRGMERSSVGIGGRDIDIALTLATRNYSDMPRLPHPMRDDRSPALCPSVTEYVAASDERVSLIDPEFRYVATSHANAEFYGSRPIRFVGAHVSEFIGRSRFERRARAHFEQCFGGSSKSYLHAVDVENGRRIMSCQMKPVRRETGEIAGAIVYMRDVTGALPTLLEEARLV